MPATAAAVYCGWGSVRLTNPTAMPAITIAPPIAACTGGCSSNATHVISELPIGSPRIASATKCVGVTRTAALSKLCPTKLATMAAPAHATYA